MRARGTHLRRGRRPAHGRKQYHTPWLGSLPLTLAIREQTDAGTPTVVSDAGSEAAALYRGIARKLAASVAALPRDMAGKFPSIVVQQPT